MISARTPASAARKRPSYLTPVATPQRGQLTKLLKAEFDSQSKEIKKQMREDTNNLLSHQKEMERSIRTDTTDIKSQVKTHGRQLMQYGGTIDDTHDEVRQIKEQNKQIIALLKSKDQSSHPMETVTVGSSSASASSSTAKSFVRKERMTVKPAVIPSMIDDTDTVHTTPEKNRMKEELKKSYEQVALLQMQLNEERQNLKSSEASLAVLEATRNEQGVKPINQSFTKRTENSIATHVQQKIEGRILKRKNTSVLEKRLPPASRDREV
mmetsp:Transcript_9580/g.16309  ORF Transcript_9580/g.16309 Transcript_9580/m.16309 type:complete len:268 (-) Transcript_9580:450-1253(-)